MDLIEEPSCPWCDSLDLVSPIACSDSDLEENWWCNDCTDYIPDPAGEKEKLLKVGAIIKRDRQVAIAKDLTRRYAKVLKKLAELERNEPKH